MKRVAILQSNYIPWRGYFDIIGLVDEFVLYDVVQFTKRDWRNRNLIKTAHGMRWLTIPVATAGAYHQTIAEARVSDHAWAETHWRALSHAYGKAPFFSLYRELLAETYRECGKMESLSDVNRKLIEVVANLLGLPTRISTAADLGVDGDRNGKLINVCMATGASVYLSGPSAAGYLDLPRFQESGVAVEFVDYSGYASYPQLHGPFEPSVTVLDLLFNVGTAATDYMQCRSRAGQ